MSPILIAAILALVPIAAMAGPADDGRWYSGPYSYSDELGGFRILDVAGIGAPDDPIILSQELLSASPVTLVIRAAAPIRPFMGGSTFATGLIHIRLVTVNGSGLPWIEYEFELQEKFGEASVFGDGLSFDQRKSRSDTIVSDSFAEYSRDFEPFDRLLFRDGYIDPGETGEFAFFITDFTPAPVFFLRQDPSAPFS